MYSNQELSHSAGPGLNEHRERSIEEGEWLSWLPKLSKCLAWTERYVGQRITGIVGGLSLLAIAAFYVTPALTFVNNGIGFAHIAHKPFLMDDNPFRHRILSPLIAHYTSFLWGGNFLYFPLIVTVLFLGAIYSYFRRLGHSQVLSLVASSTMAFSGPVLFLIHFAGYTDVLTHLFLFYCIVLRRSKFLWVISLSLAALNHEAALFSIPWVVFLRTRYYGTPLFSVDGVYRLLVDILLVCLSVVPMLLLREFWPLKNAQLAPGVYVGMLSSTWKFIFPFAAFGIFEAFKLFWFLPLFALLTEERGKRLSTFVVFALMFAAGGAQLLFSHDISRHVGHAFPIVLYSLELLLCKKILGNKLTEVLVILVFCNFFVPQYYVGQQNAWLFLPVPVSYVFYMFGFDPWNLPFCPWN